MPDKLSIAFLIGGGVEASLLSSVNKTERSITALRDSIAELKKSERAAKSLGQLNASLDQTREKLKAATARSGKLARAMRAVERPSAGLRREFKAAARESDRLKKQFREQVGQISRLREQLRGADVDYKNLSASQGQLAGKLKRARAAEMSLLKNQAAQQANRQQLNQLYVQAAEAAGIAYTLGRAVAPALSFESAMADVTKVVAFDSTEAVRAFAAEIKALSREIPLTVEELAQIAAEGGRLGLSADQLPDYVTIVAKMATAFDLLPAEAGKAIAKLSNIFGIPITDIENLGDAINQLANNTAASEADIVNVLGRVGGSAKQFSLTAVETAALADAMLALGKTPEVASTSINALLLKLQTAEAQSRKFQGGLQQIGTDAQAMAQAIQADPQRALLDFLGRLQALDNQTRAITIANMFGTEYADDISLLVGGLDQYRKALGLVADEAQYLGGVQAEFEARAATTENELTLLNNAVREVGANIGAAYLPAVRSVSEGLRLLTGLVAGFAESFPGFVSVVGAGVTGLVAMRVATLGVKVVLALLRGGMLNLSQVLNVFAARSALAEAGIAAIGVVSDTSTKKVGALSKAVGLLRLAAAHPLLLTIAVAGGASIFAVYSAWNELQEAERRRIDARKRFVDQQNSLAAENASYADQQFKTAEELIYISKQELREYEAALVGHERYWRAKALLGEEGAENTRQAALDELRLLTATLNKRGDMEASFATKLAAAKDAETQSIRDAFKQQKAIYLDEIKGLEQIEKRRADFLGQVAKTRAEINTPKADENRSSAARIIELQRLLRQGGDSLGAGQFDDAEQKARRALELVSELSAAGGATKQFLNSLLAQAAQLGEQAGEGQKAAQEAKVEGLRQELLALKSDMAFLQTIDVGFDAETAFDSMDQLRAAIQETLNKNPLVIPVETAGSGLNLEDAPKRAGGGAVFGPGSGTSDSILTWLSNGEYVIRAAAVRRYGLGVLNRMNQMALPKMAGGGLVMPALPNLSLPQPAGAVASGAPVYLSLGGRDYALEGAVGEVNALRREIEMSALKRGGRAGF